MKKNVFVLLIGLSSTIPIMAQNNVVGINTETIAPGVVLQIDNGSIPGGILLPRVALTSKNTLSPVTGTPETGLVVFNTNTTSGGALGTDITPGYFFWENSQWIKMTNSASTEVALYANADYTTNINPDDGIFMDLFAIERFNTNSGLFKKNSQYEMQINKIGYYKVTITLDVAASGGADNFGVEIYINDIANIVTDNMYIPGRWDSEGGEENNFPIGKTFVTYIPIYNAGDRLKIRAYEIDPSTDVYFKNYNTSTISIEKIR